MEYDIPTEEMCFASPYDATACVTVKNYKSFTLPSTGGAGIALFLIVGMAGVIVLSVVMMRKTKKNA